MLSTAPGDPCVPTPSPVLVPPDRRPESTNDSRDPLSRSQQTMNALGTGAADMILDVTADQSHQSPQGLTENGEQNVAGKDTTIEPANTGRPQQPFTYANAVMGWKQPTPTLIPMINWTLVGEHDLIPGERNGEPALNVSADFKNRICAPWQRTLVVRLLGIRIGFSMICSRLRGMWKPVGTMEVMDLDHDCFLVKLSNDQDYFRALTDGPWVIFDHYLVVHQWTPQFKVSDPLPKTMIVWVQRPALKVHFYHKEVLTTLGNLIGRTIKLDYHTLNRQRAKFARIAVEVDLSKHLVPRIWLDDEWQKVEYENLPEVYFESGKIGHSLATCPKLSLATMTPTLLLIGNDNMPVAPATTKPNAGFGPWMMVTRKSRRNQRDSHKKGKSEKDMGISHGAVASNLGKRSTRAKESANALLKLTAPSDPRQQRIFNQDRKGTNGRNARDEARKGKGKVVSEDAAGGKGILGTRPGRDPSNSNGPKPSSDPLKASPSTKSSNTRQGPLIDQLAKDTSDPLEAHLCSPIRQNPPPPLQTVTGPNETTMQIVMLPPSGNNICGTSQQASPSTAARTKRKKTQKSHDRKSPAKLNPTKPLQIWTPTKERKAKTKSRMASLTLQEISAWTNAANLAKQTSGAKNPEIPVGEAPTGANTPPT
ncbi:unnamed protein product [Linum trigynum]|uniref:DUF4283 domain-containing protein n=1 Tax=Linum trigynum TaxID=586398 RepID=A0AAV2CFL9_9ROSI